MGKKWDKIAKDKSEESTSALKLIKNYENNLIQKYIEKLPEYLEKRKEYIAFEIEKYIDDIKIKNDDGKVIGSKKHLPTAVITQMLGRDFSGSSGEPVYSAKELALVFEYYQEVISKINISGIVYPPTRQNFCMFSGISTSTFSSYLISNDNNKRYVSQKIEDYIIENSWTSAMTDKLNSYAVDKRTRLRNIGGGYAESKIDLHLHEHKEQIGTPDNLIEKLGQYISNMPNSN